MAGRSFFRKLWLQAHWIVGITAGVILAIVGVTGGLLAFEQRVLDAMNADARVVVPQGTRLSPPELLQRIQQEGLAGHVASLVIPGDPRGAVRVSIASAAERGNSVARYEVRYIDPYIGKWQAETGTRGETFFQSTRDLHQRLILAGIGDREVGRQIVGACTLLLVGLALSGLYLRWPGRTSNWRAWLLINPRLHGRNFLYSLHTVVGTYVLIPYLFLALTGLYWSYEWYRSTLYKIAGVERHSADSTEGDPGQPTAEVFSRSWSRFEHETMRTGYGTVSVSIPAVVGRPIEFRYLDPQPPHKHAFNMFVVNSSTGQVVRHERYADKTPGGKIMSSLFALHTGSFLGTGGTTLLMLAGLTMPLSALTGWLMYIHGRRMKRRVMVGTAANRSPGSH